MYISGENIKVIYNGINDLGNDSSNKEPKNASDTIQCLFVGVLSESKGIFYILKALRQVQSKGYKVVLNMAGACSSSVHKQITEEYNDLQVNVLGRISFEELQKYYQESDIGIIASLQEQCSYVAIEMAMFGLPIVTTAVDGLDEMFTDGVDALKVNTLFSKVFGLRVDVDMMADKIISLIENDALRRQLGENARKLYKERFNLETMMQKTVAEYKSLFYEPPKIKHKAKTSILFCIETLNDGGAEKALINILENMDPDQYTIDLLVIHRTGVYFDRIPSYVNWFTLQEAGDNLSKSFDIEVACLEGFTTKIIAYRKSNAYKIAWIQVDLQAMHWSLSAYSNEKEEELCYSKMNQIVFVSGQVQSTFNQMFPNLKVPQQVIYNPINREAILAASEAIAVSKNKFTMCSIGRLVEIKGYIRFIAVLNDLVLDGFDFEFWILGEGNQRQEIENLIKLYSLENVVYLKGFHKNPYPYLKAADMYVAPSYAEGFSLALSEAVCLGKPILATQVAGASEILNNGECGLIVEQDPQAIYTGLKRMMRDEELRKSLSNKALVHAEKLFNIRKVMEKIGYLFKNKTK
ncbi:hypothetical protein FACS1894160_3210 [Bacteroidia bacterium]|nr:hypothetical protein FACS1894123_05340 [Bacteroidia bacterium]GHV08613.1 hypothetical protein FACS1894160_3210 [Bacteroidia bacterium]